MKWDYCYVRVVPEQQHVAESLWEKGDEGWELVSVHVFDESVHLFFKKPIRKRVRSK